MAKGLWILGLGVRRAVQMQTNHFQKKEPLDEPNCIQEPVILRKHILCFHEGKQLGAANQ